MRQRHSNQDLLSPLGNAPHSAGASGVRTFYIMNAHRCSRFPDCDFARFCKQFRPSVKDTKAHCDFRERHSSFVRKSV
jgi:hypothetical protein